MGARIALRSTGHHAPSDSEKAVRHGHVIAVDRADRPIGAVGKLDAHVAPGVLHRAFSVFVVDEAGRILLQRRATTKYHFGGRWSNTCCSHQRPGETTDAAARRRLGEELEIRADQLDVVGRFEYRAVDPASGLVEHELDHVVIATTNDTPIPHPTEADRVAWTPLESLRDVLVGHATILTPWFAPALEVMLAAIAMDPTLGERYPAIASCAVGMRSNDVSAAVDASEQKSMTC